jgi:hemerythrin-like domain-containing protein
MYSVERLLRVSRGEESVHSTIDHPLEHLVACHGRIEERLQALERAGECLESRRAEALETIRSCFRYFDTSGVLHTADEEESVFPRLRGKLTPAELAEIEMLEMQHRDADQLYADLKRAVARADVAAYRSTAGRFAAFYRAHIAFENRELIRVARRELTADDLGAVSREMKLRRQRETH